MGRELTNLLGPYKSAGWASLVRCQCGLTWAGLTQGGLTHLPTPNYENLMLMHICLCSKDHYLNKNISHNIVIIKKLSLCYAHEVLIMLLFRILYLERHCS